MRLFQRFFLCLILAAAGADLRAEDYSIRLARPFKAGQKFQLAATASDSRMNAVFTDGRLMKDETETKVWELAAAIEVIAINEKGQPTALNLNITRLSQAEPGKTNALLAAGSVVNMAYKNGQKAFLMAGKEIPAQVAAVLSGFVETGNPGDPTDDDVFGTLERKKVGDQWPANVAAGSKALERESFKIDPKNVKGSSKLEALEEVNGTKCLRISGTLFFPNVELQIPKGMVARKSTVEVKVSGLFPVSAEAGRLQSSEILVLDLTAAGKTQDDHMVQLNARAERKVERKYTY
jgi:hypothetical protein